MSDKIGFEAVVMGASLGGMEALMVVLGCLPEDFPVPVLVVQHLSSSDDGFLVEYLNDKCKIKVLQARESELVVGGSVYLAPPDCHLSVINGGTLILSDGDKVNHSRPSINVLFRSAARAYGPKLIGILLTGASIDGARGMASIKEYGGLTIVQDPTTARSGVMPQSAIDACDVDYILPLETVAGVLVELVRGQGSAVWAQR